MTRCCSGGLTNLVKYWRCIQNGTVTKPIRLLYLFRVLSEKDYAAHLELWDYFANRMTDVLGQQRFSTGRFTNRGQSTGEDLAPALRLFEKHLLAAALAI